MNAMPLSFEEFQGKQQQSSSASDLWKKNCYVEPTSVLDTRRSPSSATSSSTLVDNKAVSDAARELKCGAPLGMEYWESLLSESPVQDPSIGFSKLLQSGGGSSHRDFGFDSGFGDQGYGAFEEHATGGLNLGMSSIVDPSLPATLCPEIPFDAANGGLFLAQASNVFPALLPRGLFQQQEQLVEPLDEKPRVVDPHLMMMNQNQAWFHQNPAMYMPHSQLQDDRFMSSPPPKRHHSRGFVPNYLPDQRMPFLNPVYQQQQYRHQLQQQQLQLPMVAQHLQHRPVNLAMKGKMVDNLEGDNHQLHQAIIDQLLNAAELIDSGNPLLAQGILARLNHHLSPIGKPLQRAAFYFKDAMESLVLNKSHSSANLSPVSLIYKIAAYKSFSEISPFVQFANFTCNQAILESMEGYNRLHVIDFDIGYGYGAQWASFMQEVALRNAGSPPSLKITAFVCSLMHNELELALTQENLKNFASELILEFELDIVSIEALNNGSWLSPLHASDGVAISVNLPIGSLLNSPVSIPLVLRFVKQLSPKIVVSLERGSDRTDISFPHQVIQAVLAYSSLLESLDAVNVNLDVLKKIERYVLQPDIENIVRGRHLVPKRIPAPSWRSLFLSSGFSPLTFSNFTDSQAEFLVQRTPVAGFHVEKRQSCLVLCWQRKKLVSVSAWRC